MVPGSRPRVGLLPLQPLLVPGTLAAGGQWRDGFLVRHSALARTSVLEQPDVLTLLLALSSLWLNSVSVEHTLPGGISRGVKTNLCICFFFQAWSRDQGP